MIYVLDRIHKMKAFILSCSIRYILYRKAQKRSKWLTIPLEYFAHIESNRINHVKNRFGIWNRLWLISSNPQNTIWISKRYLSTHVSLYRILSCMQWCFLTERKKHAASYISFHYLIKCRLQGRWIVKYI